MTSIAERPKTGIGAPVDRVDGDAKVQGQAIYTADTPNRTAAYGALVRATIAAGRITAIDLAAANAIPGVLAIYSHLNPLPVKVPETDFMSGFNVGESFTPMIGDEIFYQGQYVAFVIAETLEAARNAADLVRVTYERSEPKLDIEKERPNATLPKQSFGRELQYEHGDFDTAYAGAEVTLEARYVTAQSSHNPMEAHATVAQWEDDKLTLWDTTQWVAGTRNVLAASLGIEPDDVHVICPFVGGGFGSKGSVWAHGALVAAAARVLHRPVKLALGRDEMFSGTGHRSRTEQFMKLGARKDGTLVAQSHDTLCATSFVAEFPESAGLLTRSLYAADSAVRVKHELVRLNVSTPTSTRAPGEAPGSYALECAMDELAEKLGMDPIELRNKNDSDRNPAEDDLPYSSKHLKECFAVGAERFGWAKRTPAPRSMREGNELVGYGVATATYPAMRQKTAARATVDRDGHVTIASATHDLGTGMYTIMTQVAAQALDVPMESVTAKLGDSTLPQAPVAGGSMSTASVMPAVQAACGALRATLDALADTNGVPRTTSFAELVRLSGTDHVTGDAESAPGDEAETYSFESFGAHFAEVRYDEDLGRLRVARFTSVFDCGRIINHKTARSQMIGGVVWGVGMALMEDTVLDPRTGTIVTDNLADYHIPVNADIPEIDIHFVEYPDIAFNVLGARGVGEIGIVGSAAAIANAVYHATGKRIREIPMLPESLL
jgi:xanthine dehydrogenase YagR molybdenum-binding subunit